MASTGWYFTAAEVGRLTGISYPTLNYWARIGLVRPSVLAAKGRGSRRIYDVEDLIAARVALRLRKAGIFGKALVRILDVLRRNGFDSPAKLAIAIAPDGDVVVTRPTGESLSAKKRPGQLLLDFNCDCRMAVAEMRRSLQKEDRSYNETLKVPKMPARSTWEQEARDKRKRGRL